MHVRVRSCLLRIPPLLSIQARHRCKVVPRQLAPNNPRCPILSATCRAWCHPQPAHSTGSEGGSRESLVGTTTSLHAAQSGTFPISDAVPVATCLPGWTGASYPCGLASEVVIPPVRSHRQPYAEGCKRSKKEQRRGADTPRRCLCSQGMTRINGRNLPRVSRG